MQSGSLELILDYLMLHKSKVAIERSYCELEESLRNKQEPTSKEEISVGTEMR